jgi:hypothetical protein
MSGKAPDYTIQIGLEDAKYPRRVGIAYAGESGRIALKLDPGISIHNAYKVEIRLVPYVARTKPENLFGDE